MDLKIAYIEARTPLKVKDDQQKSRAFYVVNKIQTFEGSHANVIEYFASFSPEMA